MKDGEDSDLCKQSLPLGAFNPKEGADRSLLELTQTALLSPALRSPEVWPVSGGCSSPCHQALYPHPLGIGRVSPASQPRVALGRKRTSREQAKKGHFFARRVLRSPVVARTVFRQVMRMPVSRGGS